MHFALQRNFKDLSFFYRNPEKQQIFNYEEAAVLEQQKLLTQRQNEKQQLQKHQQQLQKQELQYYEQQQLQEKRLELVRKRADKMLIEMEQEYRLEDDKEKD